MRQPILDAVDRVLKSGSYILGEEVAKFERRFAELCGVKHAIGAANGTDTLVMALRAYGIGPGDEVITPPNSWVSSASCIGLIGAKPVFVDVGDDMNIDTTKIEAAITSRTKAILPVHLAGKCADMAPILEIAKKHKLVVVEDAAQSVGAVYRGKKAGSMGDVSSFSLHPLKNLNACGDAGILTTNDDALAGKLRLMRNHGLIDREHVKFWGYNSRLDPIQAAILNVRFDSLESVNAKRRRNADLYRTLLGDVVKCPRDAKDSFDVYHLFVIQTDRRDELKNFLAQKGIHTAIHYPIPIHLQEAAKYLGYKKDDFPVTERQADRILSLPIHQGLSDEQIQFVVEQIKDFLKK